MSISEFAVNQGVVGLASPDAVRALARHFARLADQMATSNEVAEVEVMLGSTPAGALIDIQLRVPLLIG